MLPKIALLLVIQFLSINALSKDFYKNPDFKFNTEDIKSDQVVKEDIDDSFSYQIREGAEREVASEPKEKKKNCLGGQRLHVFR